MASTDALQIDVTVRFEAPVNGVQGGDLLIYSDADVRGGSVNYDKASSRLRGCLWIGSDSAQALIALLAAGQSIVLCFSGTRFRFRQAHIDSVSWYTGGHPDLNDPVPEETKPTQKRGEASS